MLRLFCIAPQEGRSSTGVNFASGAAAAVVATLATQPADVIRTRMQLVAANGSHVGPVKTLQVAMQTGGAQALLVGALPRVSLAWNTISDHMFECQLIVSIYRYMKVYTRYACIAPCAGQGIGVQVLKRTVQTAVVWTLYEELVPRVTRVTEALRQSRPRC